MSQPSQTAATTQQGCRARPSSVSVSTVVALLHFPQEQLKTGTQALTLSPGIFDGSPKVVFPFPSFMHDLACPWRKIPAFGLRLAPPLPSSCLAAAFAGRGAGTSGLSTSALSLQNIVCCVCRSLLVTAQPIAQRQPRLCCEESWQPI